MSGWLTPASAGEAVVTVGFEESPGRPRKRPLFWLAVVAAAITVARLAEWHADVLELTLQNALWLRPVGLLVGCALAFLPIARWRLPAIAAPAGLAALLIALAVPVASGLAFALGPLAGSLATGLVIVGTQHAGVAAAALSLCPCAISAESRMASTSIMPRFTPLGSSTGFIQPCTCSLRRLRCLF